MGLLQLNLSYSLFLTPLNYPLIGNLARIALGLECVIVFVCLETFWSFFRKYLQSNRASQEGRNLTWGLLFIGLSCVYIVYIVADYFTPDMAKRDLTNQLAYLILAIGATSTLILTDYIERTKVKIFSIGEIGRAHV